MSKPTFFFFLLIPYHRLSESKSFYFFVPFVEVSPEVLDTNTNLIKRMSCIQRLELGALMKELIEFCAHVSTKVLVARRRLQI